MSSSPASLATPILATPDITVCRQYSFPASLQSLWDGWVQMLAWRETWTEGAEMGSATVGEVVAIMDGVVNSEGVLTCRTVGQILEIALADLPPWALECDGSEYADEEWPELAAVIHPGLRIDGSHFRTPDRLERFGIGGKIFGSQGGEQDHTLTTLELPSHNHSLIDPGSVLVEAGATAVALADPGLPSVTGDTGGGAGHNNMPPWEGTIFIIVARSYD